MFSRILVATDLSAASERMVCALKSLQSWGTREAVLVSCFNIRDVGSLAPGLMELSRPAFEKQKKTLEEMGYAVTARMVLGLPQIEIPRQAEEHDCSLIVVGSHGYSFSKDILLGGTASAVVHSARRPVLILRLNGHDPDQEGAACNCLGHILFPTDFSDNAERAFSYVRKIVESGAKRVTLLHVQDREKIERHLKDKLETFNEIDRGRLERLKAELLGLGAAEVSIEIPYGNPKKEIVDRANRPDISLVVMGSQGRGYLEEIFLGSVSHEMARRSKAPLLLVPAPR
ncbi:MAG: universal stress protein [Synergistaceae bacterium]|jgi:nucleotide-binding universal stress UspA family protein|nr:universal stress protein [Synergistaceae bacterium]